MIISVMQTIFAACKQLFKSLPLAALIGRNTLVLHGGLFRHTGKPGQKRKHTGAWESFQASLKCFSHGMSECRGFCGGFH